MEVPTQIEQAIEQTIEQDLHPPRLEVPSPNGSIAPHIMRGLTLLSQAQHYAAALDRDPWDFAVELQALQAVGLTTSDLRWMACMGYVAHAREVTKSASAQRREFREEALLTFCHRTCFVLADAGNEILDAMPQVSHATNHHNGNGFLKTFEKPQSVLVPQWDGQRHELWVGNRLVKQFKLPSPNQETVLSAFQEEKWPPCIDDPLPQVPDIIPKRRLHDTIKSLNRNQKNRLIRFMGDGTGEGVRWELRWHNTEQWLNDD